MRNLNKNQKFKAILFDLDGVLVDTYRLWFHLFNQTLRHFGHPTINLKTFARNWGQSTAEDVRIFMPKTKLSAVKSYFSKNFYDCLKYMKINPDAPEILKKLKESGFKLGCVTNSHRKITKTEMQKTNLAKFFDVVITADDVKKPKPSPDMLLKACTKLKTTPEQTIFVGDTKTDLIAGKNAGCLVIGYKIPGKIRIKNLKQLIKVIKKLIKKEEK